MNAPEHPMSSSGRRRLLLSAASAAVAAVLLPAASPVLAALEALARGPRELPLTGRGLRAPHDLAG